MVDDLGNPFETAEVDIQTMTTIPLPWIAWGGGSSWSPTVVDNGGRRPVYDGDGRGGGRAALAEFAGIEGVLPIQYSERDGAT